MGEAQPDIRGWVIEQLDIASRSARILLRDPLRLLPEADGAINAFAREHGYTVIVASTNLVFRELYEQAVADSEVKKLLVMDRAPARRRASISTAKAPPPFYPDFLAAVPPEARIELDLRQFLKTTTGDPHWPQEVSDPRYARLIVKHLAGVLRAHRNLRAINAARFTDSDFRMIVACAALGIPESAFKRLDAEDYWKIGLLGHDALDELAALAPEVTRLIKDELRKAPAPFRWLAEHDPDHVIRAFYLSVILAQHTPHWNLLVPNLDPSLAGLTDMPAENLGEAASKLVQLDPGQAERDLRTAEDSLTKDSLKQLLDQLKWSEPVRLATAIEQEKYSTLLRSLALLLALDNLLSSAPAREMERRIAAVLLPEKEAGPEPVLPTGSERQPPRHPDFADVRVSLAWSNLKQAYGLARECLVLKAALAEVVKTLKVTKSDGLTFDFFHSAWNEKRLNRLEYFLSSLERLVDSADLLPRQEGELPPAFGSARGRIQQRIRAIAVEINAQLDELNRRFQQMIAVHYPVWVKNDGSQSHAPVLTAQFLRFVLKHHWDPATEKAALLIFDGMRYDIWDELLRPMVLDRLEILADLPAVSLLPSETHVTRKAISAGTFPDQFDMGLGEDTLLKQGLLHAVGYKGPVEVLAPESAGIGETVRYRAGNLDVIIFELCDRALHNIPLKILPGGREVPSRPLAFIYQQQIKNLIDTEVMAIVRNLARGTKVFITADHGFGRVSRNRLPVEAALLNADDDCSYLNAWLRKSLVEGGAPAKLRESVWEFPVASLRMPAKDSALDRRTRATVDKHYTTLIFSKTGHALARPNAHFNPDAFSHGGISIQELLIPMIVLRVKPRDEGLLNVDMLRGPAEVVEGETAEFRLRLGRRAGSGDEDLRVDVEAAYSAPWASRASDEVIPEPLVALPRQVQYVPKDGLEVIYRFKPNADEATPDERRAARMERLLTLTISYRAGRRTLRFARTHHFAVQLNADKIVRRVGNLGNILGLTPKSLRG